MVKAKIWMDFAKLKQTFRNHESASFQDTSRTFWAGSKAQSESKSRPSASLGGRRRLKEETRFYVVQACDSCMICKVSRGMFHLFTNYVPTCLNRFHHSGSIPVLGASDSFLKIRTGQEPVCLGETKVMLLRFPVEFTDLEQYVLSNWDFYSNLSKW